MKIKNSTLISIVALFIITMFSTYSFSQNGDGYLMIRVYESRAKEYNKIIVTENGIKLEEIEIALIHYKDLGIRQIEINKILDKYENSGYKLIQTNSVGETMVLITTYLFKKE